MQTYRKASLRAGGASHPSGTLGKSLGVMISPSIAVAARRRLPNSYDISSTILPEICRQSLVRRPVFSLVRLLVGPWPYRVAPRASPLAPTYAPSYARYAISCHLMYTHTPMVLQQMSQYSQHQSTARIRVPSGPFGLAEQGLLFEHFFPSKFFRQGRNAWNLQVFDFDIR